MKCRYYFFHLRDWKLAQVRGCVNSYHFPQPMLIFQSSGLPDPFKYSKKSVQYESLRNKYLMQTPRTDTRRVHTKTVLSTCWNISPVLPNTKEWKQLQCWSRNDEWQIKMTYIHTIEKRKWMSFWYILQYGWSLKTWWKKEGSQWKDSHVMVLRCYS